MSSIMINDKVIYDSTKSLLYDKLDESISVNLQGPANECFIILLEKRPEIVNQNYFFYHVWEKRGLPINSNTFYQNISLIRKALKNAGLEQEIIKTIPRLGICINEETKIVELDHKIEQVAIENERKRLFNINQHVLFKNIFLFIVITFFSAIFFHSIRPLINDNDGDYEPFDNYKKCEVRTLNQQSSLSKIVELIDLFDISCDEKSTIYYSSMQGLYRDSLIHCNERFCMSYYYVDSRKNVL